MVGAAREAIFVRIDGTTRETGGWWTRVSDGHTTMEQIREISWLPCTQIFESNDSQLIQYPVDR